MEIFKIGIIGVGAMGSAHFVCIKNHEIENAKVVAICDINAEVRQKYSKKYPDVFVYETAEELISSGKVDGVIVATPHKFHADIAMMALKQGLHVLVEKPVDITVSKAKKLNEVAEKSDKVFGIMLNQRTNQLFKKAYDIVHDGKLGELKRTVWIVTNWYRTQAYYDSGDWRATWSGEGGGVLLNQAPHDLDIWQWICGMPKKIWAKCDVAKYHNIEVEDEAVINVVFENGANGTFIVSTGEFPGTNRLEITGTLGKIVLENGMLKWWKLAENEKEVCFSSDNSSPKIDVEYEEIKQNGNSTAHKGILQNFTNAVLKGEKLLAPGIDGINELTISNAAYLSSWKNCEIELPFDEDEFDKLFNEKIQSSSPKNIKATPKASEGYSERWSVKW
ncbi:MAG: Gfo/Idh/MocA family oxidoreductase [Clostridia bacterium]|nr:Gfo/Idh/MocA family oxidoreductase [Clostridia bacterium]